MTNQTIIVTFPVNRLALLAATRSSDEDAFDTMLAKRIARNLALWTKSNVTVAVNDYSIQILRK